MNTKPSTASDQILATIAEFNRRLKPEWLRLPDATRVSGLSRSSLYERIATGEIRSVCLRKRGAAHGVRLISYDSLLAYIEQAAS